MFTFYCNTYDLIIRFFKKPLQALKDTAYDDIIPLCTEVIKRPEFDILPSSKIEVLLLRATFYLLLGKHNAALQDFASILNSEDASDDVKINSLIKRAASYMQLEDTEMTFKDFDMAITMNPSYSDIYHHRGQVLTLSIFFLSHTYQKVHPYNKST